MSSKQEAADALALEFMLKQTKDNAIDKLRVYARKLIDKFDSPLIGLDMRCQMLADIFTPSGNRLQMGGDLGVADLCERFCKKKLTECFKLNNFLDNYKPFEKNAFDFFKATAAKQLFPSHPFLWKNKVFSNDQTKDFESAGLSSAGQFIDESLAHYFASLAILEVMQMEKKSTAADSFVLSTLCDRSDRLTPVRAFLGHLLARKGKEAITPHPFSERWLNVLDDCFQLCNAESNSGLKFFLIDSLKATSTQRDQRVNQLFRQLCPPGSQSASNSVKRKKSDDEGTSKKKTKRF